MDKRLQVLKRAVITNPIEASDGNHSARLDRVLGNLEAYLAIRGETSNDPVLHLTSRIGVLTRSMANDLRSGVLSTDDAVTLLSQLADAGELSFDQWMKDGQPKANPAHEHPTPLLDRSPFSWLRERDIDLLLCSELHAGGALRTLLETKLGIASSQFEGAWVSHSEADGENDLVIGWATDAGLVIALVENKIAAVFQPDQGQRYKKRAQEWATRPGVEQVSTVLLAPREYLLSTDEPFDIPVAYEEVNAALRSEHDPRSAFLAEAIMAGIAAFHAGYVPVPDATVSSIWQHCWELATDGFSSLAMEQPGLKPASATWIYFRRPFGFSPIDREKATLVYKADRGQADLQFRNRKAAGLNDVAASLLEHGMHIEKAGQSASIRLHVPKVDFRADFLSQSISLRAGLEACEVLRSFFIHHRTVLLA